VVDALVRWCLKNPLFTLLIAAAIVAGGYASIISTPVDAIPDIGEKQVIVFADWPGRSPQDVDDQVTYPLTTSLTGTPGVKAIRSMSGFGFGMVFVIFRDEVDYYWARSRVLERMNVAQQRLPQGVVPVLGPDATALGQVYWYTLEAEGFDLAELRSIQDWYVRYQLNAVEGVSEVASAGGFVKQYQIDVHPDKMRAHRVTLPEIIEAVRRSNIDVGAKVIEKNGVEFFVRGVGFVKSVEDLEKIVIRQQEGSPITVRTVGTVTLGPDFRRGALDKAGREVVGGVVVMRYGENPLAVVRRLKEKIRQLEPGLPSKKLRDGRVSRVKIVPFYDRTEIVQETIATLKEALTEEAIVGALVILMFLLHLRSTLAVLVTLPLSVALCFMLMRLFGVDSNIMSLAGLAIAIGDVADMGIIMTENIYRRVAERDPEKSHFQTVYEGATEVAGAILTAVSNTLVSFIPVFFLEDQEGKLFRPLAFTKTFAIAASVVLAITVVPVMCYLLFAPGRPSRRAVGFAALGAALATGAATYQGVLWLDPAATHAGAAALLVAVGVALAIWRMARERFLPIEQNAVSSLIARSYAPSLRWVLRNKVTFMSVPVLILIAGIWIWSGLGREFMPPLDEGAILYMPSLLPHASLSTAVEVNRKQDLAIASIPEVETVVGKLGRAESALDPAPIGMFETIVNLKPESEWRVKPVRRFFSDWPRAVRWPLAWIWPEERRITRAEILEEMQAKTAIPGVLPTFLQPIQTRLVMLQTGFRAMMGVKVYGSDLREIERICLEMETVLKHVPGATDVVADRIVGKPYVQFDIDRDRIARYGVNIRDVQDIIEVAIGGINLTESVEGRERYPIRVRYVRELRADLEDLRKILVPASGGAHIPLAQIVDVRTVTGPQEIKGERGLLVGYVTMNTRDLDEVSVVESAEAKLQEALRAGRLKLPQGYYWEWGGQFQNQQRATARLKILVPSCLLIMFLMLWHGFRRWWIALIIYFGVLVSASGGFMMLAWWGANLSVAVWVGFLVLFGVVDDDGVVMGTYLEDVFEDRTFGSVDEIREAVVEAGLKRIRPCLMTTATTIFGLLPVFWATGRGSDVMQPMAIPSVGGMTIQLITLFIVPCMFCAVEEWKWRRGRDAAPPA
jgi:Cu(I)/Ag(I) efflux system membrane protein CusA/SilA